jgi:anti-anti-sigma regulatory factor
LQLALPDTLDLTAVPTLKLDLQSALALADGLEIDATGVQRITSPCLQVLVSAARSFAQAGGPGMRFSGVSQTFSEAATHLALSSTLGLEADHHE